MTKAPITPVILAGGAGSRLWPLSRTDLPKQFCRLVGDESLFQSTLRRVADDGSFNLPIVVTNARYHALAQAQAETIGVPLRMIICEDEGRNTGPAIALAALAGEGSDDELMLVLPSDHKITNDRAFGAAIDKASTLCEATDTIVVLGIEPTRAETGYGYIKEGKTLIDGGCKVSRFIEKPPAKLAEAMIAQGGFLWNAGIFLARRGRFVEELSHCAPELTRAVGRAVSQGIWECGAFRPSPEDYAAIEPISFDHAVMEKTKKAAVVAANPGWSDLGSFAALHETSDRSQDDNVFVGDIMAHGATGCLAVSKDRLVALSGVNDLIVVVTDDAVLVTPRSAAQSVKEVVTHLELLERREVVASHPEADRPWGHFASLHRGRGHQVKTIKVNPGGRLSLQYHDRRAEHWIVVSGTASVTLGKTVRSVSAGQHVHVPKGEVHRLENLTDEPLEVIEVQLGDYLGEDDIVRLEDAYGRGRPGNPTLVA